MSHQPRRCIRPLGLALAALCLATPVLADDDDCAVPMADWQPRKAVSAMAATHGWTVRRIKIDDGCYEIYARDADGAELEIRVDPATLAILEVEREDDDDDDGHDED